VIPGCPQAEPTLRARSALVTAAQGLLKHPAMHTVLLVSITACSMMNDSRCACFQTPNSPALLLPV
jgi:hypothetical protein